MGFLFLGGGAEGLLVALGIFFGFDIFPHSNTPFNLIWV